jgi:ribonucleoside-diphosphate reductase alpha chain
MQRVKIAEMMRNEAYRASIKLASEKGSFPLLDADKYLQSGFAKRLPADIREGIKAVGLRNSHPHH